MTITDITTYLEQIAPLHLQESYDNAGLLVGHPDSTVKGAVVSLDMTEEVVLEAVQLGLDMVIAHHPIIFSGLKRLNGLTYVERAVISAIRHGVALYAIHTNLDNIHRLGVNERIAQKLGLTGTSILQPKPGVMLSNDNEVGAGLLGYLDTPMDELAFLGTLKKVMGAGVVKHTRLLGREVRTVAVCGGSGGFLLKPAIAACADVFVTADYKYHEFFDANDRLVIADIGHYESEQYTIDLIFELLSEKFPNFAVRKTEVITNPVHYL